MCISDLILKNQIEQILIFLELATFMRAIHDMFYVSVHFDHHFYFKTVASQNMSQIQANIYLEINERSKTLRTFFSIYGFIMSIFFCMIVLRAIKYKQKFLTKDRFDNFYIGSKFDDVDKQRKSREMESVLPLIGKEKRKYIRLTSYRLIFKEKFRIARSAVFLFIASIHMGGVISTDYSLFWMLATIRRIMKHEKDVVAPPMITLNVEGSGMLAEMYAGMFEAFDPMTNEYAVDSVPCLPTPFIPDLDRYVKIALIILLYWILLIFEPYGLRVRQIVLNAYYPIRARERAIWLYNNILRKRSSFFKIARRQARRKFLKDKSGVIEENFGFMDYIRAKYGHLRLMRMLFGKGKDNFCCLCGKSITAKDDLVECMSLGCTGKFCFLCYKEMNGKCFLCHEPFEYGDTSDYSEEKY